MPRADFWRIHPFGCVLQKWNAPILNFLRPYSAPKANRAFALGFADSLGSAELRQPQSFAPQKWLPPGRTRAGAARQTGSLPVATPAIRRGPLGASPRKGRFSKAWQSSELSFCRPRAKSADLFRPRLPQDRRTQAPPPHRPRPIYFPHSARLYMPPPALHSPAAPPSQTPNLLDVFFRIPHNVAFSVFCDPRLLISVKNIFNMSQKLCRLCLTTDVAFAKFHIMIVSLLQYRNKPGSYNYQYNQTKSGIPRQKGRCPLRLSSFHLQDHIDYYAPSPMPPGSIPIGFILLEDPLAHGLLVKLISGTFVVYTGITVLDVDQPKIRDLIRNSFPRRKARRLCQ